MANESLIGRQLENFKVEKLLGRGGMAEVYYGQDVNLQRPVAIKVINARFRADPDYADRFVSEARAVAQWRHENIVQVYYAGKQNDLYYFVMEYIDGMDLDSLLHDYANAGELMPHTDVVQIGRAVAGALDYAHTQGVIHRDVKPANVMISTDDRVVLMDFGLALNTQQGSLGEVLGTPQYVSPEQARRSADAVPQSDVYSFGVMLYEMLTGVVPFDDPSPTAVALQHLSVEPPSPRSLNRNLTQAIEEVLLKALAKAPTERYQSAIELIDALEAALTQAPKIDPLSTAELPPLPPGMEPPDRSISSRSVTERVALGIEDRRTHPPQPKPTTAPAKPKPGGPPTTRLPTPPSSGRRWLMLVPLVLVVLVVGGFFLLRGGNGDEGLPTLVPSATIEPTTVEVVAAVEPTATMVEPTTTTVPPTATMVEPTTTTVPPTATMVEPTATVVEPTTTTVPPTATTVLPTATIPPEPTVLYPSGRSVQLLWNEHSFYWHNPTGDSVRVGQINFEALDAAGNPIGSAFNGERWTMGFSSVEAGKCVAIEILATTEWLRPGQCNRGYNSQLTLQRSDNQVFWLARGGVSQFRVLWGGEEIGRCDLADQFCEVLVP